MKTRIRLFVWATMILTACSSTGDVLVPQENSQVETPAVNQPFLISQDLLDSVTLIASAADTAITGDLFGVRRDGSDRNLKDIYTNKPLGRAIQQGDIFVIRSFNNDNGRRGQLEFIDVMVRREPGYNSVGGDFEYFRMNYDATTDYSLRPNGIVPSLDNITDRGLNIARANCTACHRLAAGGDFMFTTR